MIAGPIHQDQPVIQAGHSLNGARTAMLLLHGRGASARDILDLAGYLELEEWALVAPQARENTWYPYSFLSPIERNEPWLSSALALVDALLEHIQKNGVALENTVLLGFSQGACLATEYAARRPTRYGGVIGLSGGLIGPEGTKWGEGEADGAGYTGTPVFLGCSDQDPHIPRKRVLDTAEYFRNRGAEVTERLYPHFGHGVNEDEIRLVRGILRTI
jgi:predicted esterase